MNATPRNKKPSLDSILEDIIERTGFDPRLAPETYRSIADTGLQARSLDVAFVAVSILIKQKPCTLRGLFYQVVSRGLLPNTNKEHYQRLGRIMTKLREEGIVPFSWLVDNVRATQKTSSWAGITDYADVVRDSYRLDFWARLPEYAHVIVEKDAIAGVLAPVCREYDIALSPIRGYVSLTFAHEIASTWNEITKPITCYYLGDFDPSGFDLERDVQQKLRNYTKRSFEWVRLGVNAQDFEEFNLGFSLSYATRRKDSFATQIVIATGFRYLTAN